jgi:hypothetical protein
VLLKRQLGDADQQLAVEPGGAVDADLRYFRGRYYRGKCCG